jgi:hypothetical protein
VFSYFDRVQAESLLSGFEEVRRISSEDYVDTYEYSDATYYEELDGAKGNIVIIRSPVPERPSISIEAPAKRPRGPQSSGGLSYEPLGEEYRRLGAEITHVVLLDVGASVHDQAHEVFLEFLAGMGYE